MRPFIAALALAYTFVATATASAQGRDARSFVAWGAFADEIANSVRCAPPRICEQKAKARQRKQHRKRAINTHRAAPLSYLVAR
jgi:hypothetical protein